VPPEGASGPAGKAAVVPWAAGSPDDDAVHSGSTWIFEAFGIPRTAGAPDTAGTAGTAGANGVAGIYDAIRAAEVPGSQPEPRHALPGRPRTVLGRRPWTLALIAGGLAAAVIGGVGLFTLRGGPADIPRPVAKLGTIPSGALAAVPSPAARQPAALPVALTIPAIDVRTKLIKLGVTAQGTLQVPSSTSVAGWYTGSPRPGDIGSSVIAGHIDSYQGPGVFFRLRLLHPGDFVYVREADGRLAVFRVNSVRVYPKDHFPTAAVYGPAPDAELRLITCGGPFDYATGSYLSNVVAYTTEVS
jgi:sortase (surface protein transpeptidase)